MVTVRARIETIPPSHQSKAPDREIRELTATTDTYEQAYADVQEQVPDGWRLLHVLVDR